jgi:hypothetical protein
MSMTIKSSERNEVRGYETNEDSPIGGAGHKEIPELLI